MKDQYVGDINDYIKYSVLRALGEAHTTSLLVCWMLTADDDGTDGRKTSFLRDPARYRSVDPELFDSLDELVRSGVRSTTAIESLGVLPGASFFRRRLEDAPSSREGFLNALWSEAKGHRVIFFDPDNGLGIPSIPAGRSGSRRYIYCSELTPLRELNAAAVIYQHFPRVPRTRFVAEQLGRLATALPGFRTAAVYTSHVAFLVVTPPDQQLSLERGLWLAANRWTGRLNLVVPGDPTATDALAGGEEGST